MACDMLVILSFLCFSLSLDNCKSVAWTQKRYTFTVSCMASFIASPRWFQRCNIRMIPVSTWVTSCALKCYDTAFLLVLNLGKNNPFVKDGITECRLVLFQICSQNFSPNYLSNFLTHEKDLIWFRHYLSLRSHCWLLIHVPTFGLDSSLYKRNL